MPVALFYSTSEVQCLCSANGLQPNVGLKRRFRFCLTCYFVLDCNVLRCLCKSLIYTWCGCLMRQKIMYVMFDNLGTCLWIFGHQNDWISVTMLCCTCIRSKLLCTILWFGKIKSAFVFVRNVIHLKIFMHFNLKNRHISKLWKFVQLRIVFWMALTLMLYSTTPKICPWAIE